MNNYNEYAFERDQVRKDIANKTIYGSTIKTISELEKVETNNPQWLKDYESEAKHESR